MFEVPTDRGTLWFKACCDHFVAEAAIVRRLAQRIGDLVPVLVAGDDEAGWLLMEPMRGASDRDRADGAVDVVAPDGRRHRSRRSTGSTSCAPRAVPSAVSRPRSRRGTTCWPPVPSSSAHRVRAAGVAGRGAAAEARVREFWACGIPDTLSHGDLHPGNVAYDGREVRIFDWTDGCVTHPLLDGSHLAGVLDWYGTGEGEAERVMQAYARPWREAPSPAPTSTARSSSLRWRTSSSRASPSPRSRRRRGRRR